MVTRNLSFYERKKKLLQKHELCTKRKVHMNFSGGENVDIMDFCE